MGGQSRGAPTAKRAARGAVLAAERVSCSARASRTPTSTSSASATRAGISRTAFLLSVTSASCCCASPRTSPTRPTARATSGSPARASPTAEVAEALGEDRRPVREGAAPSCARSSRPRATDDEVAVFWHAILNRFRRRDRAADRRAAQRHTARSASEDARANRLRVLCWMSSGPSTSSSSWASRSPTTSWSRRARRASSSAPSTARRRPHEISTVTSGAPRGRRCARPRRRWRPWPGARSSRA